MNLFIKNFDKNLHKELKILAATEGVTLRHLIVDMLRVGFKAYKMKLKTERIVVTE